MDRFILVITFTSVISSALGQINPLEAIHPDDFTTDDATVYCVYNSSFCEFRDKILNDQGGNWTIVINGDKLSLSPPGTELFDKINTVVLQSGILTGVKCLYFTAFTSRHPINWALSVRNPHRETLVGLPGGAKLARKITVGLATDKEYIISFYLYGFENHGRPMIGSAYIGPILIQDGPCLEDAPSLNCTFDTGFCNWTVHNGKYDWYQVPFGLHHTIPHAIEWGALAAFAGKGGIWSPVVRPFNVRCFSFIYARGEGENSFLRVWLLYRIPGFKDIKVLLFEDVSGKKIIKKEVQISIYVPFNFQIAFEGKSQTILHGVIVLNTAISKHPCEGTGDYIDIKGDQTPETPTIDPNATVSSTERSTTPTTAFAPI